MKLKSRWIVMMFAVMFCGIPLVTMSGCKQGPLEEAAEEIEDEIDDATDG